MNIRRRKLLGGVAWIALSTAGCVEGPSNDPRGELDFQRITVRKHSESWRVTTSFDITVRKFENILVVIFDDNGDRIGEHRIGTVDPPGLPGGEKRELELDLDEFPAILSAEADAPPCDDRLIDIMYWTGTDDQRGREIPEGETVWEDTFRECDEAFPPKRVVETVQDATDR
jgi:hypothetical protein